MPPSAPPLQVPNCESYISPRTEPNSPTMRPSVLPWRNSSGGSHVCCNRNKTSSWHFELATDYIIKAIVVRFRVGRFSCFDDKRAADLNSSLSLRSYWCELRFIISACSRLWWVSLVLHQQVLRRLFELAREAAPKSWFCELKDLELVWTRFSCRLVVAGPSRNTDTSKGSITWTSSADPVGCSTTCTCSNDLERVLHVHTCGGLNTFGWSVRIWAGCSLCLIKEKFASTSSRIFHPALVRPFCTSFHLCPPCINSKPMAFHLQS